MSEQNLKWLFPLLPFLLAKLMEWSGTSTSTNFIYKGLVYCQYGVGLFFVLAIGFHLGLWWNDKRDRTFSNLKEECLKEIGYKIADVKHDYVPMKEEISRLKTLLDQVERRERYFRLQYEEAIAYSRRTPADANKVALASVAEV